MPSPSEGLRLAADAVLLCEASVDSPSEWIASVAQVYGDVFAVAADSAAKAAASRAVASGLPAESIELEIVLAASQSAADSILAELSGLITGSTILGAAVLHNLAAHTGEDAGRLVTAILESMN